MSRRRTPDSENTRKIHRNVVGKKQKTNNTPAVRQFLNHNVLQVIGKYLPKRHMNTRYITDKANWLAIRMLPDECRRRYVYDSSRDSYPDEEGPSRLQKIFGMKWHTTLPSFVNCPACAIWQ
jgi:hypothetical protein